MPLPENETKKPRNIFRFVKSLLDLIYNLPIPESLNVLEKMYKINPGGHFHFIIYRLCITTQGTSVQLLQVARMVFFT